jgi:putative transposase
MIQLMAEFCGIQIITYCLLSNHFHVLLRTPGGDPATMRNCSGGSACFTARSIDS